MTTKIFQWLGFISFMAAFPLAYMKLAGIISWSWWIIWLPWVGLFIGMPALCILLLILMPILDWSLDRSIKKSNKRIEQINKLMPLYLKKKRREERIAKLKKIDEHENS